MFYSMGLFHNLRIQLKKSVIYSLRKVTFRFQPLLLTGKMAVCAQESTLWDFPGGPVVKNLPANAGHTGLIPGLGRLYMPRGN